MPSTMTHAYMARDIYDRLDENIKNKFNNQLEEYVTYSQGPDIFFFYRIFLPFGNFLHIQNLGRIVHRKKVNELLITLTNEVKKTQDIDQFVFLCGFLTHYLGDTTCHPLVNYLDYQINKSKHHKKNKDYHFVIESYIDNYILNKKGQNYKKFPCHKFSFNAKKKNNVEKLLNESFEKVFNEKNIGIIYYKSLKDMKFFFYILRYDPYQIKKYILKFLHLFVWYIKRDIRYLSYNFNLTEEENNKYLNLNHSLWYNVRRKDKTSVKSFEDLYDEVVNQGQIKIKKLYDYIYNNKELDLKEFFGNLSYSNGLPLDK